MRKFKIKEVKTIQTSTVIEVKDAQTALNLYKTNKAAITEVSEESRLFVEEVLDNSAKEISIEE